MADFYQNGVITTLHNLSNRPLEDVETELVEYAKERPLGLLLPSLYSELEGEALPRILDHLTLVPYLSEIVIGLDRADEQQYRDALRFFSRLPQSHRVLWQDGPRLRALDAELREMDLAPREMGKGRNVWYCMGYILGARRVESIAIHDCDILTYERSLLARLIYPVANPNFNYEFCKGYYARVSRMNKINGRVSRLLVTPLLRALKKTLGEMEAYLEYMDSFRYPLAGEFSFRRDVLNRSCAYSQRLGTGDRRTVGDVPQLRQQPSVPGRTSPIRYDHKHQELSEEDAGAGLSKHVHRYFQGAVSQAGDPRRDLHGGMETFPIPQGHLLPHRAGLRGDLPQ